MLHLTIRADIHAIKTLQSFTREDTIVGCVGDVKLETYVYACGWGIAHSHIINSKHRAIVVESLAIGSRDCINKVSHRVDQHKGRGINSTEAIGRSRHLIAAASTESGRSRQTCLRASRRGITTADVQLLKLLAGKESAFKRIARCLENSTHDIGHSNKREVIINTHHTLRSIERLSIVRGIVVVVVYGKKLHKALRLPTLLDSLTVKRHLIIAKHLAQLGLCGTLGPRCRTRSYTQTIQKPTLLTRTAGTTLHREQICNPACHLHSINRHHSLMPLSVELLGSRGIEGIPHHLVVCGSGGKFDIDALARTPRLNIFQCRHI